MPVMSNFLIKCIRLKNCAIWYTVCQKFHQNSLLYGVCYSLKKYFTTYIIIIFSGNNSNRGDEVSYVHVYAAFHVHTSSTGIMINTKTDDHDNLNIIPYSRKVSKG